jgi:hypothetical protein
MITTFAGLGLGNMLILPALIGVALSDVGPERAGTASGTLNTTMQFAGSAGIAVIGAVFFAALGPQPGRAGYAHAAAAAAWIDLGLTVIVAVLSAALAPRPAGPPADRGRLASPAGDTAVVPSSGG